MCLWDGACACQYVPVSYAYGNVANERDRLGHGELQCGLRYNKTGEFIPCEFHEYAYK